VTIRNPTGSIFDEIEVYSGPHYKLAFHQRYRDMICRSNLVVSAVNKNKGGAYSTMKYAVAKEVNIINLYEMQ